MSARCAPRRIRRGLRLASFALALSAPLAASADLIVPDDVAPDSAAASAPASATASAPTSAPASAAPASAAPAAPASATPSPEDAKGLSSFEKAERLEALRYRHLWIAYACIWLLVFAFAWRTWKRSGETGRELTSLKARLDELERAAQEKR